MSDVGRDVRAGRDGRPAGPRVWRDLLRGRRAPDAVEFMVRAARDYGDLVSYRMFGKTIYQVNHPDLVADYFLKDAGKHHRGLVMQKSRDVLGHGLLTSEEPMHMRQRRLAQPAFLRDRIAGYGAVIGEKTLAMTSRWQPAGRVDLYPEMLELALRIVGKCLFDLDELEDVNAVAEAVDGFMSYVPLSFLPFAKALERLPLPAMNRLRRGKVFLDEMIYGMIAERRRDGRDRGDLLSMLLSATDDGSGMSDRQLRDECVTIILAGHETTANALSFSIDLLGRHPKVQERLAGEAREVLGKGVPTAADFPRLPYAYAVFAEAMRLYPPVWVTGRTCAEEYEIAGFKIPVGTTLLAAQCAVHRDARFWEQPEIFNPERFLGEAKAGRPRYAYFPFAGGSRQCIAEGLAWMEGTLALAGIFRDWRVRVEGPAIRVRPAASLRPARGVVVALERR